MASRTFPYHSHPFQHSGDLRDLMEILGATPEVVAVDTNSTVVISRERYINGPACIVKLDREHNLIVTHHDERVLESLPASP